MTTAYRFEGKPARRPFHAHPDSPTQPEPYLVNPELVKAVNLAIYLKRPLLLEGEAGCGKTRLAPAVAYELGLPFYRWDIRSTSKAQDELYEYDAILRLHDVQAQKLEAASTRDPRKSEEYRTFGALGNAFTLKDCPAVVLIDEIDKADIDFPNDLLAVLDEPWQFTIRETGETIKAAHQPIVIISSNKEKGNLPAPFLRRCLYYFMEFPDDPQQLQTIVAAHYEAQETLPKDLIDAAIDRFLLVRREGELFKKPGTSEFLDWLKALMNFEAQPYPADALAPDQPIPHRELLFKLRADWQKYATA
ncbi:MoxR family ATPase [Leptolyngbya sp. FACHB-321]|uniref:AAA family ATPase n=1 Tax=Leptolyngbya sp. FACHB-321 TaxID=2692807 RepID=UPI001687617E|nr:MoxR family ATPase [Leptolyngbya sp. FACHB-321]MBD2033831.1 MoxR family ATPase [Leptolyngbya sp. FACHB-321]